MTTATAVASFYAIVGNSDYYWRVLAPAQAIGAKPILIPDDGGYFAVTQPNDDTAFRWRFDPEKTTGYIDYPDHEGGTAVWTRPDLARATHAKAMREQLGVWTVAETDDNYLADSKFNVYMRGNRFGQRERLQHMKAMASMNAMVFSTAALRDFYWKHLTSEFGRRLPQPFVCRNHVLADDWPDRVERDGPVRVGWMGSPSHVADVNLAWPALMHARNLGCETWMIGYDPADPECAVTSDRAKFNVEQWGKVGYRHQPWERIESTRRMALPLDIGLCPLLTNEFTLGKSDVKAVEYTIAGAAVVAWNMPVYNRDWIHGETCLLVGSAAEAIDAVDRLARDESLRERLVANAQQYVREERGRKQLEQEWGQVLAA